MLIQPLEFVPLLQNVFDNRGRVGCCLIHAVGDYRIRGCGVEWADIRLRPMSTFKVLNSLIALETGVIDPLEGIDWDGGPAWSDALKTRMTLDKALSGSALWFFQILARRIGVTKYRRYLAECSYGNAECCGDIDSFWLNGSLLISPREQLEFVSRFSDGDLPFSEAVISAVQEMLIVESAAEGVLRGKTGYANSNGEHFGWFIGYQTFTGHAFRVVTLLEMSDESQLGERREIAEECIRLMACG